MNTKINLQTILIVFMLCVTVIVTANSPAKAQVGGENNTLFGNAPESEIMLDPVPGGPGFIMVSVFDFTPYYPTYQKSYWGTALYNTSNVEAALMAGLTLPHGATITKMTLYFTDNFAGDAQLDMVRAFDTGGIFISHLETEGASTASRSVSSTGIIDAVVDNQNNSYFLQLRIPASADVAIKIANVRIDYEYTSNLPAVLKN